MPNLPPSHTKPKPKTNWNNYHQGKTSSQRGYGSRWQRLRKRVIQRDKGLCQPCLKKDLISIGSEVDHIIPKAKGGTDDEFNLQTICKACHKEKTSRESNDR